jgi:hypothetical protein
MPRPEMSADTSRATPAGFAMKRFRLPQLVAARFIARRTLRGAVLWGVAFAGFFATKTIGFVQVYQTEAARQKNCRVTWLKRRS